MSISQLISPPKASAPPQSCGTLPAPPSSHPYPPTTSQPLDTSPNSTRQTGEIESTARNANQQQSSRQAGYSAHPSWQADSPAHRSSDTSARHICSVRPRSWWGYSVCHQCQPIAHHIAMRRGEQKWNTYLNQLSSPHIGPNVVSRKYSHFSRSTSACSPFSFGPSLPALS